MEQEEIIKRLKIDNPGSPFYGCEIVITNQLPDNEMVIRQGDKLHVCPNFTVPNELKYMVFPTFEEEMEKSKQLLFEPPEPTFFINNNLWENVFPPYFY